MNTALNQISTKRLDMRQLPALAKQHMDSAKLPELYVAAQVALKECACIDEIKDIRDKHSAIAHYAKQAKDDSLFKYAERIKLRAIERIGELLAEIPDPEKRKRIAKENNITPGTANDAVFIAGLPKRTRDKLIDADSPPKYREITNIARDYSGYNGRKFWNYKDRERVIQEDSYRLWDFIDKFDSGTREHNRLHPEKIIEAVEKLPEDELEILVANVERIFDFLDVVEMAASRMIRIYKNGGKS